MVVEQQEEEQQYALCLNMIVKNESHIIKDTLIKLLQKVKFDYWVISDTGSTDETRKIITDFFKEVGIPGELYQDAWVDFAHNRNKALQHAFGKSRALGLSRVERVRRRIRRSDRDFRSLCQRVLLPEMSQARKPVSCPRLPPIFSIMYYLRIWSHKCRPPVAINRGYWWSIARGTRSSIDFSRTCRVI